MVKCPVCGKDMRIVEIPYEIPYFGEAILFSMICENCGFKKSDVIIPSVKEGVRYSIEIKEETLTARVVKSSSATVKIPELDIEIIPGIDSKGLITNVEGILIRIEDVLEMSKRLFKGDEKSEKKLEEMKKKLEKLKLGEETGTLVIEDPTGNSVIIHKEAKKEEYREEE